MAKGARNKKRQKARNIRREKFAPREHELRAKVTENPAEKMEEETRTDVAKQYDEKTMKNKDGQYAPWMSQRERKKLIRENNKVKSQKKNTEKRSSKKLKKVLNTEAGR